MGLPARCRSWLSLKWLWLSHVYPFYWAHHPLCQRFGRDVLRIGRMHLCRSCVMVYAGLALGVLLCAVFRRPLRDVAPLVFAALAGVTLAFCFPVWYKIWSRPMRDVLRAMMGGTIALCGYLLLCGSLASGLIGMAVLGASYKGYLVLRRWYRMKACAGCRQLRQNQVCPGFALQAERIRQHEQKATDLLIARGYVPP